MLINILIIIITLPILLIKKINNKKKTENEKSENGKMEVYIKNNKRLKIIALYHVLKLIRYAHKYIDNN